MKMLRGSLLLALAAFNCMAATTTGTCQGYLITLVNVKGDGPNSAQLEFSISPTSQSPKCVPSDPGATFAVFAYPSTEPQVFVAISNLVTAAFLQKQPVTVGWESDGISTPRAIEVQIDSNLKPVPTIPLPPPSGGGGSPRPNRSGIFTDVDGTAWAVRDSGYDVTNAQAKTYCTNLTAGGLAWTLPTIAQVLGLYGVYENRSGYAIRGQIQLTTGIVWASDSRAPGLPPAVVSFRGGYFDEHRDAQVQNSSENQSSGIRALCVSSPKATSR